MKLVTYNIQYSKGKDGRFDLDRITEVVREADVICMQEVVRNFEEVPDRDQPARIAELLPRHYWVYGPTVDLDASTRAADGTVQNQRCQFGNMVLARWPILSSRLLLLPRVRSYEMIQGQRGALEAIIDGPDGPLRIYSVHLNHLNPRHRRVEIRHLLPRLFAVPGEGTGVTGPTWHGREEVETPSDFIVMGDFNLQPDSGEYVEIVGESDYYYGRSPAGDRLVDTWTQADNSITDGVTWYDEEKNWEWGIKLDYGFVSPGLASRVAGAWIDDEAVGSDHQPTWFELA